VSEREERQAIRFFMGGDKKKSSGRKDPGLSGYPLPSVDHQSITDTLAHSAKW